MGSREEGRRGGLAKEVAQGVVDRRTPPQACFVRVGVLGGC